VLSTARLIASKDLRAELRSRVATYQVLPFAVMVLVLFAFALDPDRNTLRAAAPGLYWLSVLLTLLITVQRAFAVETDDGALDALKVTDLSPAGIFLGKAAALAAQLLALEVLLAFGTIVLYNARLQTAGIALVAVTCVAATCGLAALGTLYGALSAGLRARATVLPLLLLPAVAPILIGATRAFEAGFDVSYISKWDLVRRCEQVVLGRVDPSEGWPWVLLLAIFAAVYVGLGLVAFGPLLEEG
jgi:heme exporter protein B